MQNTETLLKISEVTISAKISKGAVYLGAKNGTFPKPIKLGVRSSAWIQSEVEAWKQSRIDAARA
jgi:prophage regulatory protein